MNIFGIQVTVAEATPAQKWMRRAAAIGVTGAVVLSSGVAYAVWTASGSGSGSAKAGTASQLTTVSATASTTSLLYPNGPAADLRVAFDNPNPFAVKVTAVSAGTGSVTGTGGIGSCTTTGVTLAPQTGQSILVPAKSGSTDGTATATLTGAVSMDGTSDNGCQSATFVVPVSFAGTNN
jgi:hypothetical protein